MNAYPELGTELPGAPPDDQAELPVTTPEPPPPQEETPQESREALASIFANPQDLQRYHAARANGASEAEALKVGDNGVGKWGDVTASYKIPMVALPSHTPGIQQGRLIKVEGPSGSVIAKLADVGAPDGRIDLNPAAAMAVGHNGGLMPVKWQYVGGTGDMAQTPNLPAPSQISIGPGGGAASPGAPILGSDTSLPDTLGQGELPEAPEINNPVPVGSQFVPTAAKDQYGSYMGYSQWFNSLQPGEKGADGAIVMHNRDGSVGGKLYPDGSFVWEAGGQRYAENGGQIKPLKGITQTNKTPQQISDTKAAEKNVLRAHYPEGPLGDQQFEAAKQAALNPSKPKIFRDSGTGLAFDISDTRNPKPIDLPGNPASVDLSSVKQGDWSIVPEDLRDVAKSIAEYKYPPISGFALRSPYFQQMFKIISRVDPSFSYMDYNARKKAIQDFTPGGKLGQNILSFNTAMHHISRAIDTSSELAKLSGDNGKQDFIETGRTLAEKEKEGKDNGLVNQYRQDVGFVSNEIERAASGAAPHETSKAGGTRNLGIGSLSEQGVFGYPIVKLKGYRDDGIVANKSQRDAALKESTRYLGDRLSEVKAAYEHTFGKSNVSFISPEAEKALQKIGAEDLVKQYGSDNGKKPYVNPEAKPNDEVPWPGSDKSPQPNHNEVVEDQEGNKFYLSPENKLIPYGQ